MPVALLGHHAGTMRRGTIHLLVLGALLLTGCEKQYEVTKDDCAIVPADVEYELTEASKESVPSESQRTVKLRMIEEAAREDEGPGTMVPKGSAIQPAEEQDPNLRDWTKLTVTDGPAEGTSGLVRRVCLGESG